MKRLQFTQSARRDLVELWAYLADENSEAVADQQIGRVFDAFDTLREFPEAGRRRPELRESVRSYTVHPLVIFYTTDGQAVSILHVVHGSRDLPRLF
ncbi:MAG: type II toxin-antitoxin system RelE/ParE family toxin [Planctomycetota bacterium]